VNPAMGEKSMGFKPLRVVLALMLVGVPVVVMWQCIFIFSQARYISVSDGTLSYAFAIGNAMPILVIPGIFVFLGVIQKLKMTINAQKTQIDDLKRELEKGKE
jgi:hypothetical protein